MFSAILEQHAGEASFLWSLRDAAATAPHYDLASLAHMDERVEAHVDGLRIGGDAGWTIAEGALGEGEAGAVFAAALLALDAPDPKRIEGVVAIAAGERSLGRALVSGIGWAPAESARRVSLLLFAPNAPASLRRLGLAACAAHRIDPGAALGNALVDDDPELRARALRAVGELGLAEHLGRVRDELRSVDAKCRLWAAWSAAIFGEATATAVLWRFAEEGGLHAERAALTAARRLEPREARARVEALAVAPRLARAAPAGAAACGDPALVPMLLEIMTSPPLARLAADALHTITGIPIDGPRRGKAPDGFVAGPTDDRRDPNVALDPDEPLPWPDPAEVAKAWHAIRDRFRAGARYLLGAPITRDALGIVLRRGTQRLRAGAALDLAMLEPGKPLFEVRAPAPRQRLALNAP